METVTVPNMMFAPWMAVFVAVLASQVSADVLPEEFLPVNNEVVEFLSDMGFKKIQQELNLLPEYTLEKKVLRANRKPFNERIAEFHIELEIAKYIPVSFLAPYEPNRNIWWVAVVYQYTLFTGSTAITEH